MKPSDLERSLVRQLRAADFPQSSPPIAVFSAVEYTLDQMASALSATSAGILVEPDDASQVNPNVPGASFRLSWSVRAILNAVGSMGDNLHPLDVATAAHLALNLKFPRNENGEPLSGGQWQCSGIKCEAGEFRGNYVRTAVFTVSAPFSTQSSTRH